MGLKKTGIVIGIGALLLAAGVSCGDAGPKVDGKKVFDTYCIACHKDGGNIINPKKTLKKGDLRANGIKTADDIVKLIRKPGPGMTPYDKKTISDEEARAVAEYVLKTF